MRIIRPYDTLAAVGMTVFNIMVYLIAGTFKMMPSQGQGSIFLQGVVHFSALLLGIVFSQAALGTSDAASHPTRTISKRWMILSIAAILVSLGERCLGMDLWLMNIFVRIWGNAGLGFIGGVSYFFFFSLTPREKICFRFGASIATGIMAKLLVDVTNGVMGISTQAPDYLILPYAVIVISHFIAAAVAVILVLSWRRIPLEPVQPLAQKMDGRNTLLLRFMLAFIVFNIMSSFLAGKMHHVIVSATSLFSHLVTLLLAIAAIAIGWLMGRGSAAWVRRITFLYACAFVLAPCLLVLKDAPLVSQAIYLLSMVWAPAMFVCMTLAVNQCLLGSRWNYLATGGLYCLRVFVLPGFFLARSLPGTASGLNITIAVAMAVIFLYLMPGTVDKMQPFPDGGEPEPPAEPAPGASLRPMEDTSPRNEPPANAMAETHQPLFRHYGLTPRESEIACLLSQGMSTHAIAGQLGISAHTVNTHVKKILRKFNIGTRTLFVSKLLSGQLSADMVAGKPDAEGDL